MSKSFSIANNKSIKDAIKAFNKLAVKSLAVVKKNELFGVISDGDIRKMILKNVDLSLPITKFAIKILNF